MYQMHLCSSKDSYDKNYSINIRQNKLFNYVFHHMKQYLFWVMKTLIVGPFISHIASPICFQQCLKEVIISQQPTQDHQ
jgi:hypothetical protein